MERTEGWVLTEDGVQTEKMYAFRLVGNDGKPAEINGQFCGGWVLADEDGFNLEEGRTLARQHELLLIQRTMLVLSHHTVEDYREGVREPQ
jgi:hypothetical protein